MTIYKKDDISPISQMQKGSSQPSKNGEKGPNKKKTPGQGEDPTPDKNDSTEGGDELSPLDKEIEEKLKKGRTNSEKKDPKDDEEGSQSGAKSGQASTSDRKNTLNQKADTAIVPAFNWSQLIRQFVGTVKTSELTRTKPSNRAATQVGIAQQIGVSAVQPGERPGEEVFKLLMVFDTSGSMHFAIPVALAETRKLLKTMSSNIDAVLGITFFADSYQNFAANLTQQIGWKIGSFTDLNKPVPALKKKPLNEVLSDYGSGGTNFSSKLSGELSSMAAKGYNVILFSDEGIMDGHNWDHFVNLYKAHRQRFFFITNSSYNYTQIIKKMGIKPPTFGHLPDTGRADW